MGVMLYLANNQPQKAEAFIRDAIVRSMEQSTDKNVNFIRISTIMESLERYFSKVGHADKAKRLQSWLKDEERRFKKGEPSVFDQFAWLRTSKKYT